MLSHGDRLLMDGLSQDELQHRTDPGLESDRIHLTFPLDQTTCPRLSIDVNCGGKLFNNVDDWFCLMFGRQWRVHWVLF